MLWLKKLKDQKFALVMYWHVGYNIFIRQLLKINIQLIKNLRYKLCYHHLYIILLATIQFVNVECLDKTHEFQRYDGWFNNLANPEWGSVGSRLHRDSPANYEDGVYKINVSLPSARTISDIVFKGPSGIKNKRNITTMLAFFSQVVAYEIMQSSQTGCPLENIPIPVEQCDSVFDPSCEGKTNIPFMRTKYDTETGHGLNSPREQINERTSWIDASFLYSTNEPWVAALRSWHEGTLTEGEVEGYPPLNKKIIPLINPAPPQIHRLMDPERLFTLGDPRINENPGLLTFGLILFRWHNFQALKIAQKHPDWTDEEIFQGARRMVIASLQNIILYEFLPEVLGIKKDEIPKYGKYNAHIPPGISHSFATAAFRFHHTIVPPGMLFRKKRTSKKECVFRNDIGGFEALRLCQNWWNAQDIVQEYTVDEIILGMASQISEAEDTIIVEDLRDFIFGPMYFTRLDVVSSSIMRGRDNGIPFYNDLRRNFALETKTWETINPQLYKTNQKMFDKLKVLYKDIKYLDAYVGGMLETNENGMGELFKHIIRDQFLRLRDGDRFWFENRQNGIFTEDEIEEIKSITLSKILRATTNIEEDEIQDNVFIFNETSPCPQPFQVNTTGLEQCIPMMRYDHFNGIACVPLICIGVARYLIIRRRKLGVTLIDMPKIISKDSYNNSVIDSQSEIDSTSDSASTKYYQIPHTVEDKFKMPAIEWLSDSFCRSVNFELDTTTGQICIKRPRSKGVLRKLNLGKADKVLFTLTDPTTKSTYGPFIIITIPKNYDMVIRLHNDTHCAQFMKVAGDCLKKLNIPLTVKHLDNDVLLQTAETKEKRQKKLDLFFREAYAKSFQTPQLSDDNVEYNEDLSRDILGISISKSELADALGMREDNHFVDRLFAVMVKNGEDSVSFESFLELLKKFTNGSTKDKMNLLFNMCDYNGDGQVERAEFIQFFKSLSDTAGVKLDKHVQEDMLDGVLLVHGVDSTSKYLTEEDLEKIFTEVDGVSRPVGVHLRGAKLKVNLDDSSSLSSFAVPADEERSKIVRPKLSILLSFLETYRQHIAWIFIFFSINALLFLERFWHYRFEVEHRDLRRVLGTGIAITRGAAAAISFSMSLILLTVCRNLITVIRVTPIGEYIPLDSAIVFHKIIGYTIAFFSAVHTIGHLVNFYNIATQSQEGLQCLFQEAVFGSNFAPTVKYWFFGTMTGLTGILIVIIMCIIYIFSIPSFMHQNYNAFIFTHWLNIGFYGLTLLHGLPKLLDSPKFWYQMLGPLILFIIDKIIGMRQQYKQLRIIEAAILPSDIIYIQFKRPHSFNFYSGQWVRISCPDISCPFNEDHAFSMAAAPQSPSLELYIKAVGPWTRQLRSILQDCQANGLPYPTINLSGPFGDGNQEWTGYDIAVMVGGGIGITPYASILMDLVLNKPSGRHTNIKCKKVYFLWICPTHKNYEWFVDVLKDVEKLDTHGILENHIFITQFFHKFDLRTTMLYICEKHFRTDNNGRSMFTGLRAVNHFGRPNFDSFFKFLQNKHNNVEQIGVFSCGPATVNKKIRQSCTEANRVRNAPSFVHRFETF
uniref:NAD(P)H oxidase (H2O2-forming) n=1 Tax=Strongyloides stercoralis TaxID=6248 RepID=A0A0K0DSC4_STRER